MTNSFKDSDNNDVECAKLIQDQSSPFLIDWSPEQLDWSLEPLYLEHGNSRGSNQIVLNEYQN